MTAHKKQNRLIKRLRQNPKALKWLNEQGLQDQTINSLKLGLSEPYQDYSQTLHENALVAPVRNETGDFVSRYIYFNIPGVTINPDHEKNWMKGSSMTYYAQKYDNQTLAFVCDDIREVWLTDQLLTGSSAGLNILLFSFTPGKSLPGEWSNPEFWSKFERIYLGTENSADGDKIALKIVETSSREMHRVRMPRELGRNWLDYFGNGKTIQNFFELLSKSYAIGSVVPDSEKDSAQPGRYGYNPVDITRAFHNGHLYYSARTFYIEETQSGGTLQQISKREIVIVRSDRTIHQVKTDPAPRGTPPSDRITRLTDGTIIEKAPNALRNQTWDYESITRFCAGKSKIRSLAELLEQAKNYIKNNIWLPYDYDYDLLALLVPVTYAQASFDSVPMILVTGPPQSGKSALGRTMLDLCANASMIGQASAATVARLIHETQGFVVLDDLESIVRQSKKDTPLLSDLVQSLKISYNKETSLKLLTSSLGARNTETLNLFGVKMINNTQSVDQILGTRFLTVRTSIISEAVKIDLERNKNPRGAELKALRNDLHMWTFSNVSLIAETYRRVFSRYNDRQSEIVAPLKVFAELANSVELSGGLERALKSKSEAAKKVEDPIELMELAVRSLIEEGYKDLSVTHISLQMKAIAKRNNFIYEDSDEKWHNPAWVGRHLRTYDLVQINSKPIRFFLHGIFLRIYPINERIVKEISSENNNSTYLPEKNPTDFCRECSSCSYASLNCPIMKNRFN